ncbi:MAG: glycosyltransferase [Endomicrobiia bacterium]|nr:glycosyltransferase [Endomicrobiia bacterium]
MSPRPSILYVITSFGHGGAQKNMLELAARARDSGGFKVAAVALKDGGIYEERFRAAGIETETLGLADGWPRAALTLPSAFAGLVGAAERVSADIIHSFLFQANILGRFAARLTRAKNISSVRVMEREKKAALAVSRFTGFLVDEMTVNSDNLLEFARSTEGLPAEKIKLIRNYVGTKNACSRDRSSRRRFGFSDGDFVVAAVGRLSRQKGFEYLVDAVSLIKDDIPRIRVVIVGDGELKRRLDGKIISAGLSGRVILAGESRDPSDIISSANLVAIPSLWEGFPNVALEAVAAGVPVVATDACALDGFLDGDFIVAAADAVALAHKILEIERDPAAARRSVESSAFRLPDYTSEDIFENYFKIYRALLGES